MNMSKPTATRRKVLDSLFGFRLKKTNAANDRYMNMEWFYAFGKWMHNCDCMKLVTKFRFFFRFVVCDRCCTCGIWSKKQPNAEVKWIYPLLTNTARGEMRQISHTYCVRPDEPFLSCSILHYNSRCGRHTVCRKSQPNIIHSLAQFEIS